MALLALRSTGYARRPKWTRPPSSCTSDGCAFPEHAKAVYAALRGQNQLEWSEGSQIDFYDQDWQVARAIALAVPHFQATLGAN